jgi:hypothetical protein
MITGISIQNFKGISERVTLDLRPITLLFGANSAGKSTILHALHYAREVFERHNLDVDRTVGGGAYVDLGGFRRILPRINGADPTQSQQAIGSSLALRTHCLPWRTQFNYLWNKLRLNRLL